jgi:hypothetical protein
MLVTCSGLNSGYLLTPGGAPLADTEKNFAARVPTRWLTKTSSLHGFRGVIYPTWTCRNALWPQQCK